MTATVTPIASRYVKTDVLLKVDHVSLKFKVGDGERIILRDVCADISDIVRPDGVTGQVVCFLGPSGIGKTQLSRVMAGLQKPSGGGVYVDQGHMAVAGVRIPEMLPVHKGLVGMVPQNYTVFEFATVHENFTIAGKMAGLTEAQSDEKSRGFIEEFGLEKYMNMYPAALSGGTRQRVAIVQQLMCSDHFLIMDEPFSGLDPVMKSKACELITQVANRDELNTIVLVTHDVTEGMSVADTIWLMGREAGLPGARVVRQIDLADMDLCWHPDIQQEPRFQSLVADVKASFAGLNG